MLSSLVSKLRTRFGESTVECGASSDEAKNCQSITTETLIDVLEEARIEYSTYQPMQRILKFAVSSYNPEIELGFEPYAVTGVYVNDSYGYGPGYDYEAGVPRLGRSPYLARYFADPALARVDNTYLDYSTPEATYIRAGTKIFITSPLSPASQATVHLSGIRDWSEMPEWAEVTLVKLGLIKLIDRVTTSSEGLLRIPTPTGYFEFDGGRVMQNLRSKLEVEAYRTIQARTHGLMQG